jgi:hypothetical protein
MLSLIQKYVEPSHKLIPFKFIMRVIGAYGIIQVFAQDIGLPTGCKQARFTHNLVVQIIIFTCAAYAVTDDFVQSFLGTIIYFSMKYLFSGNVTNNVCFADKDQIANCGKK